MWITKAEGFVAETIKRLGPRDLPLGFKEVRWLDIE